MTIAKITSGGVIGTSKTSSSTVQSAAFTTTIPVGSIVVAAVSKDNVATGTGVATNEITSVTDTAGNTYTKIGEYTNGQGSAAAGITTALFYCLTTVSLASGTGKVTANFSASVGAAAITVQTFSVGAGNTAGESGTNQSSSPSSGTGNPGSLVASGLTAGTQYLVFRCVGHQAREADATLSSPTTSWSFVDAFAGTTGGSANSNVSIEAEYIITSGSTSYTSNPTASAGSVNTNIIAAIYEILPPPPPFFERQQQLHYMRN